MGEGGIHFSPCHQFIDEIRQRISDNDEIEDRSIRFAILDDENRGRWPPICGYAGCGISFLHNWDQRFKWEQEAHF